MGNETPDSGGGSFCINCGENISNETQYCPECGTEQVLEKLNNESENEVEQTGFTSWAIGFEPGRTVRNIIIGLLYFFFYPVGVILLLYAYSKKEDKSETVRKIGKIAAWGFGILFILVGLGSLIEPESVLSGIIAIALGVFLLPPVRKQLENLTNYQIASWAVVLIAIIGLMAIGAAAPASDTPATTSDGLDGVSGDSNSANTGDTSEPEYQVRIIYGGPWQGALSVTGGGSSQSESISGRGSTTIDITGQVDIISVNAQKQDAGTEEITVQIIHNGDVVSEADTRSEYGIAQTSQSFY